MARCLLIQSGLPPTFWAEAVNTANYIRNKSPTSKLKERTPYEAWFGKPPDVSSFRRFGSEVLVMDRSPGKGKLEARSKKGIFVGYSSESKAYRIWLPEEKRIETSRDVSFTDGVQIQSTDNWEDFFPRDISPQEMSSSSDDADAAGCKEPHVTINLLNIRSEDEEADQEDEGATREECEPENASRRDPGRPRIVQTGRPGRPRKVYGAANYAEEEDDFAFLSEIPVTRAMASPESAEWTRAMADEVKSILRKDTWDLVDRSKASKVIGSRFVLRNKYGADGVLERRKARIVAKGYAQQYGKDFYETYALVARLASIRSTIAFAAKSGMHIRQYDVATAYLNGELDEEVHMEVPDRMEEILEYIVRTEGNKDQVAIKATTRLNCLTAGDKVCLMNKALYGLKQAGRAWNKRDRELRALGAKPTNGDPCVYVRHRKEILIIIIYVDDMLVMCRDPEEITCFGRELANLFEVKDLGDLKHCLGWIFPEATRAYSSIRGRTLKILLRFGMSDCNAVSTPLDVGTKLVRGTVWSTVDGEKPPYQELVGCLLYLSLATRPDIAHAASALSQFTDCFNETHWGAAKRILRYLKGTNDQGIFYSHGNGSLASYVDADWGESTDDWRSFTGHLS
ncbi:gag-pol polyprotein [Lasius niger]|uniref:Gag-pol polyprotein n=1 Tax=Lasius niger TaxID=67767 RepID=A0A0J7N353_LASNI|nr:gag-pol polyprotein [Lasius niger]